MSESLHLDDLIGTPPVPPVIIRTNRKGHGEMNKHDIFASKKEKKRGVQPGGRRRKKSRKIKRRKRPTGRSGKKKTRKKTATVHKFEIIKRNPLTIKIFEKQGKKWVLKETHVAQKGGTLTRLQQAEMSYVKYQVQNGTSMKSAISAWRKQVKQARDKNKKKLDDLIDTQLQKNPQSAGRRKTRRRKTRKKRRRKTKRKKTKRRRRKKTRRQIGCNK